MTPDFNGSTGALHSRLPAPLSAPSPLSAASPSPSRLSAAAPASPPPLVPSREASWYQIGLSRGESLYRTGDPGGTLFRVDEGLLKLVVEAPGGKERIVALAGPGDLFGDLASADNGLQESAEALSDNVSIRWTSRSSLPPGSAQVLLEAATTQLARLRELLEDADLPVDVRLARTFERLGRRFGQRSADGSLRITLPLTHDDLGAMIGAARETTSTAVGQIRSVGLLTGTRGRYSFRPGALARYAAQAGCC